MPRNISLPGPTTNDGLISTAPNGTATAASGATRLLLKSQKFYARLPATARHTFRRSVPHARAQTRRARSGRALLPLRRTQPHNTPAFRSSVRSTLRHLQRRADKRPPCARLHPRREAPAPPHAALLRQGLSRVRLLARRDARLRPCAPAARPQDDLFGARQRL